MLNKSDAKILEEVSMGGRFGRYGEAKEPISEPLACTAGCYYCCFYQVLLIPPEALLIGNYIEKAYTDQSKQDLMERIETTLRLTEGKSIQERVRKVCV